MKIQNIRLGHATNSSSTHSIVIMPPDYEYKPETDVSCTNDFDYGWEQFILADSQAKSNYIATQLFQSMVYEHKLAESIAAAAVDKWFGVNFEEVEDFGVDHQSALSMPKNITTEFIRQLKSFVSNERVIIYGGNDNDGRMDIPEEFSDIPWLNEITDARGNKKLKNDGKYWVLYDGDSGAKIRFSIEDVDDMDAIGYTKASSPELVDVKITDYCPFACEFCYQASTKDGLHVNLSDLTSLFWGLGDMNVFEVALGGGEPTMHPQFVHILENAVDNGLKPNFTTFSKKWLNDRDIVEAVKKHVGGIGVSLHNTKDFEKMKAIAKAVNGREDNFGGYWSKGVEIVGQHVLGTHPLDITVELIKQAWDNSIPVLLLGYKNVGFGNKFKPYDTSSLPLALKLVLDERRWSQLSVDTAVLDQHKDLCDILNIDKALTSSPEGKFSMYIDMVEKRMAPSSYVPENKYVSLSYPSRNEILEHFVQW